MGYSRAEIEESLSQAKYDDIFATYLLLGRKNNDVRIYAIIIFTYKKCISLSNNNYYFFSVSVYSPKATVLVLEAHCH